LGDIGVEAVNVLVTVMVVGDGSDVIAVDHSVSGPERGRYTSSHNVGESDVTEFVLYPSSITTITSSMFR
jgi:hypothetical protein